ncbi:trypsin-like peptidase domain-containing protein [Lentzea sp. NPDC058436]|uniref:trypsin-like peptidase domain-containing protein n=1 Tax=Lentzea sp. NPDC058436 TaxID=3346499 RepID=UPI00364968E2
MPNIDEVLERHKERLLDLPGCTGVSLGRKVAGGTTTDEIAIVLHVAHKGDQDPDTAMPATIEGFPTDVVEATYRFENMSTDPFERHDPLFGGISVTALEDSSNYGTIGCFVKADGTVATVRAGVYLLTNRHVVTAALGQGSTNVVIQPGNVDTPDRKLRLGAVVASSAPGDSRADCAIVELGTRGFRNEVPNHPKEPGHRKLVGIDRAQVGDEVYKYGATTGFTWGVVEQLNFSFQDPDTKARVDGALLVKGRDGKVWCNGGDSGSVLVREADDMVVGLNFKADTTSGTEDQGYTCGLAYDITSQISRFSTAVALA